MIVYSHNHSPRLAYILQFLSHYFETPFEWTGSKEKFLEDHQVRINYSPTALSDKELWIEPLGLLEKTTIEQIDIQVENKNGCKVLFPNAGDPGFDLFSAIFYLISRYEEYLPHAKDEYGRFAYTNSIAFKQGFLQEPLINIWLSDFRDMVEKYTGFKLTNKPFQFLPTYDIDIAWSYRNKGLLRNLGACTKQLAQGNFLGLKERMQVLVGAKKDPYDCYEYLDDLHRTYDLKPVYFFHVGSNRNQFDKSIAVTNKNFQSLIKETASRYEIGLHPSWHSGNDANCFVKEKKSLERISSVTIFRSRQHYIRFSLPITFQQLKKEGITEDYSMGYGSINGFRASVAAPFYWYDLQNEIATNLLLVPFCFMDANAFFEEEITSEQAFEEMMTYYQSVKKVGGLLSTLWHNTLLGTDRTFGGWRAAYERFLQEISLGQ